MDKNSIFGILLIAGILIIWGIVQKPNRKELEVQRRNADSLRILGQQAGNQPDTAPVIQLICRPFRMFMGSLHHQPSEKINSILWKMI